MYFKYFKNFIRNLPDFKLMYSSWNVHHLKMKKDIFSLVLDCERTLRKWIFPKIYLRALELSINLYYLVFNYI